MEEEESGIDELMRLSQQFTRQEEEREEREKQREAKGKQVQGVLQGLKELKVSMAIEQLKTVATPKIIEEVNALRSKQSTEDLRKAMSNLADDLETHLSAISAKNPDAVPMVNSMRTLNILMDLYFSL
jgi:predicted component of type VI protein secretion system